MPAGQDLIFFDSSEDWQAIVNLSRTARKTGEDSYIPIPPIDLGVSLKSEYVAVIAGTTQGRPSWQFAGDIRQIYNFAPGGSNPVTGVIQSPPTRLFINKLQVVETTRISPDNFRLRYTPPFWFRDCTIKVYRYTGDALNFVEDSLFAIGNALGVDPNQPESPLELQIQLVEQLINERFRQLDERLEEEAINRQQKEQEVVVQINQLDAGIYTLAEGIAELLPGSQGEQLKESAENRLNLDLGFL